MRGMLVALSPHEEAALRKIRFGNSGPLEPAHVRRLQQLQLIERDGETWRLTPIGRQRYENLTVDGARSSAA